MLRIRLPYPDRALNPNVRRVWQASLKPKKEAREVGYWAAVESSNYGAVRKWSNQYDSKTDFDWSKPLRLRIAIHPPDNRRRDLDNIVAALKPYQDGVMDYIGLDDSLITHKEVVMRRSCPGGKVIYILYQK